MDSKTGKLKKKVPSSTVKVPADIFLFLKNFQIGLLNEGERVTVSDLVTDLLKISLKEIEGESWLEKLTNLKAHVKRIEKTQNIKKAEV